jgi:hypothetical protein
MKRFLLLAAFLLSACTPSAQLSQAVPIIVYATPAAQPWLTALYDCAAKSEIVLSVNADAPEIYLRLGEPDSLTSPAYQIDEEEILIVTHRESPIQNLTLDAAQALFAQGDPLVQVWVYSSDADVQIAFDQLVMKGRSVTAFAGVTVSPQKMSDLLNSHANAVGILPRHWKARNVRDVFSAGTVPVLAITKQEPQGAVAELISCLQGN